MIARRALDLGGVRVPASNEELTAVSCWVSAGFLARRPASSLQLKLCKASCGEPRLEGLIIGLDGQETRLFFNVSHTENITAVAVAFGREVGEDLEMVGTELDSAEIVETHFSKDIIDIFLSSPEADRA